MKKLLKNFRISISTLIKWMISFDQLNDNDISLVNEKDSSDTDEKLNPSDLSAPPGVK